ncbi:hypothetical protein Ahy_A05g025723 [Arachis hypogaea]|uniref:Protein FAR1-RELATED SEQUENCE n=1 Tax=Arachis hypogaea TaxID=3818 RepID=A0A445D9B3_ARAHY|nr:hypothetical protein Ahy_A05g025723 [Arachis hypogaea]
MEHFFGRIRTTSRCKEIHSLLKNYIDSKTSLLKFMHQFSEVLRRYRNNHLTTDFDTCLKSFKKQATKVYTRNIFKLVKDEIEAASVLNMIECPNSGDIVECNTISYNKYKDLFPCECRLFETRGLPCSHIFGVLKHRNVKYAPRSLILKRWTRDGNSGFICSIGEQDSADDIVHTLRCGVMASICWKLCDISSKNSADYRKTSSELLKLISKVQKKVIHKRVFPPLIKCSKKGSERPKEAKICTLLVKKRHFIRIYPLLFNEDSPTKYSNTEDELTILFEEYETSKQTHSQDTKLVENS